VNQNSNTTYSKQTSNSYPCSEKKPTR